jgi:hypothetical protein
VLYNGKIVTSTTLIAPATSCFEHWYRHFLDKRNAPDSLPWREPYQLSATERRLVGRSIQQFQLGEWARGRGFKRRAASHSVLATDRWFLPALELFIAEEQGHSEMLGRFLDHEHIPRLSNDWADDAFRRLRKLAGLELCVTVLVTAEVLAMPFYQALRDATSSNLLRSICVRILCDEAAHLNFQALTIGLTRRPLSDRARALRSWCHTLLFRGTAFLLWWQHRGVFHAAGWDFGRFWKDAWRWFALLQLRIREASLDRDNTDALRLD